MALFYAPLAYGATTPSTLAVLDALLFSSFALWLIQLLLQQRTKNKEQSTKNTATGGIILPSQQRTKNNAPRRSPANAVTKEGERRTKNRSAVALLFFLSLLATLTLLNPARLQQAAGSPFLTLQKPISWLPGTLNYDATFSAVIHFAALGGAFLVLLDLIRHRGNRGLILKALALSGFVTAIIGIVQKASGADAMLWANPEQSGTVFFSAFRYHANSASFLNLSWPAALAVWLKSRQQTGSEIKPSIWLVVLFFTIVAVFVNSSKAGQVLGLLGLGLAFLYFRHSFFSNHRSRIVVAISLLIGLTVVIISIIPNIESSIKTWDAAIGDGESLKGRLLAYRTCIHGLPESGLFGTGPGTFRFAFPDYNTLVTGRPEGYWYHAHQDYLQTLIEWGFLGGAAWALIFIGAIRRGLSQLHQARRKKISTYVTACSLLALLLVLLHALVDFPLQIPAMQIQVSAYLAFLWNAR